MILIFERLHFKDLPPNYWSGKRERKVKNKYIFMIIGNLCIKKNPLFQLSVHIKKRTHFKMNIPPSWGSDLVALRYCSWGNIL